MAPAAKGKKQSSWEDNYGSLLAIRNAAGTCRYMCLTPASLVSKRTSPDGQFSAEMLEKLRRWLEAQLDLAVRGLLREDRHAKLQCLAEAGYLPAHSLSLPSAVAAARRSTGQSPSHAEASRPNPADTPATKKPRLRNDAAQEEEETLPLTPDASGPKDEPSVDTHSLDRDSPRGDRSPDQGSVNSSRDPRTSQCDMCPGDGVEEPGTGDSGSDEEPTEDGRMIEESRRALPTRSQPEEHREEEATSNGGTPSPEPGARRQQPLLEGSPTGRDDSIRAPDSVPESPSAPPSGEESASPGSIKASPPVSPTPSASEEQEQGAAGPSSSQENSPPRRSLSASSGEAPDRGRHGPVASAGEKRGRGSASPGIARVSSRRSLSASPEGEESEGGSQSPRAASPVSPVPSASEEREGSGSPGRDRASPSRASPIASSDQEQEELSASPDRARTPPNASPSVSREEEQEEGSANPARGVVSSWVSPIHSSDEEQEQGCGSPSRASPVASPAKQRGRGRGRRSASPGTARVSSRRSLSASSEEEPEEGPASPGGAPDPSRLSPITPSEAEQGEGYASSDKELESSRASPVMAPEQEQQEERCSRPAGAVKASSKASQGVSARGGNPHVASLPPPGPPPPQPAAALPPPESPAGASSRASCSRDGSTEPGSHNSHEARRSNGSPTATGFAEGMHEGSHGAEQDGAGNEPEATGSVGSFASGGTMKEDPQKQPQAAERLGPGMVEKLRRVRGQIQNKVVECMEAAAARAAVLNLSKDDPGRKASYEFVFRMCMEQFQGDMAGTGVELKQVLDEACLSVSNLQPFRNTDGTVSTRLIPLVERPSPHRPVRLPSSQQHQVEEEEGRKHRGGGADEAGDGGAAAAADREGGCELWGAAGHPDQGTRRRPAKRHIVVVTPEGPGGDDDHDHDDAPVRTPGRTVSYGSRNLTEDPSDQRTRKRSRYEAEHTDRVITPGRTVSTGPWNPAVEEDRRQPRSPIESPASDADVDERTKKLRRVVWQLMKEADSKARDMEGEETEDPGNRYASLGFVKGAYLDTYDHKLDLGKDDLGKPRKVSELVKDACSDFCEIKRVPKADRQLNWALIPIRGGGDDNDDGAALEERRQQRSPVESPSSDDDMDEPQERTTLELRVVVWQLMEEADSKARGMGREEIKDPAKRYASLGFVKSAYCNKYRHNLDLGKDDLGRDRKVSELVQEVCSDFCEVKRAPKADGSNNYALIPRPEHQLENEDLGARDADHEVGSLGPPAWDGAEGAQHHQHSPSHHARHAELDLGPLGGGGFGEDEGHDGNMDAGENGDGAASWTKRVRFLLRDMLGEIAHDAALHLEDFQKSFLEVFQTSLKRSFAESIGFLSVKHMLEKSCSDICQVRRRRMDDKCCQWDLYPQSNKERKRNKRQKRGPARSHR